MIKLTNTEWEIIAHRLESGCIPEVLAEDFDEDVVADACDKILIRSNKLRSRFFHVDTDLFCAILAECVEGSTYLASHDGSVSGQKYAAIEKCCIALADKVSSFIGRKVKYPQL